MNTQGVHVTLGSRNFAKNERQHKQVSSDLTSKTKLVENLEEVYEIFDKKLPLFITLTRLGFIEKEANKFLSKIDASYHIKFSATDRDSLDIVITDLKTMERSPVDNLSGFEETIVGLSVRMGLAVYNSQHNKQVINMIAVDEPDKSADEASAAILFKALDSLNKEFQQVIIITHKESIKESFYKPHIIEVHKDQETSHARMVA